MKRPTRSADLKAAPDQAARNAQADQIMLLIALACIVFTAGTTMMGWTL